VGEDDLNQFGAHLYCPDARFGLRLGDQEARPLGVVQPQLADLQGAQLAHPHARVAQGGDDWPAAQVLDGTEV
jgi:hypothetical protein